MQEWVSIYETGECDIGVPDIHRFLWVDELSTRPLGFGASHAHPLEYLEGPDVSW